MGIYCCRPPSSLLLNCSERNSNIPLNIFRMKFFEAEVNKKEEIIENNNSKQDKKMDSGRASNKKGDLVSLHRKTAGKAEINLKSPIKVVGLSICENELEGFLTPYFAKLHTKFIESFGDLPKVISKGNSSVLPKWLSLEDEKADPNNKKELNGLAVYGIDVSTAAKMTVEILHISCIDLTKLEACMAAVLAHIWENTKTAQVRIKLSHKLVNSLNNSYIEAIIF
jgi:hypothetical protein